MENQMINDSNRSTGQNWLYGGDAFHRFSELYEPVHLPLSLLICFFGIVANALNVIVLTRRSMITSTNVILTGLSAAQLFLLINYLLLLIFNVCASKCIIPELHSYPAVTYKWINVNVSVAFHTTALSHTLVLATFRFLAVKLPAFARTNLNVRNARLSVALLHLVIPILCTPTFFTSHVAAVRSGNQERTCGLGAAFDLDYVQDEHLLVATMWTFGVFFKLVPSLTIVHLSFYLITSLKKYNEKKDQLTGKTKEARSQRRSFTTYCEASEVTGQQRLISAGDGKNAKKRNARRTMTKMLVLVALLCASVELPHGIVNLLTAIFGQEFGMEVYDNLGDLFEMLTLLYSSVNFILYCAMSTEFRCTFWALFYVPVRNGICKLLARPVALEKGVDPEALVRRTSCLETAY